jgi:hypothetical protein
VTHHVLVVGQVDLDLLALLLDRLVGRRGPGPGSSRGVDEELTLSSLRTWEYYKCEAALLTLGDVLSGADILGLGVCMDALWTATGFSCSAVSATPSSDLGVA